MQYRISLLGRFAVQRDGGEIAEWPRAGARRLLKLLALAPQRSLSQERAAVLLWPHEGGERVRQRLHHLVYLLRATLDAKAIETADGVLRLRQQGISIDVEEFEARLRAALQPGADAQVIEAALALYGGPLLPGERDEPLIEHRRAELEQRCVAGLAAAAQAWRRAGEPTRAVGCLQRLLALQPADEAAHRALIELFAELGQREAAERQYAACKAALSDELGVVPGARTHQAYREALLGPGGNGAAMPGERFEPPLPVVAMIGRDALLERLVAELTEPATRLLTVVGPGGMGKTLMALHAARRLAPAQRDGACFVSLAEVDAAGVPERLRRALRVPAGAPAGTAPGDELVAALRERQLLLVCDNAEHVGEALGVLGTLLDACPQLKLLVTSRRRLNLRAERVFELPALDATPESAMRLFEERARAASPGFALDAGNAADVEAIIRRLDGVPLAIELVAARTPLYPPAALRRALEVDLGLVAGGGPDRPARHRSLAGSLAWSLALLSPAQRRVLHGASLFAAPFETDALRALQEAPDRDTPAAMQVLCELRLLARASAGADAAPRWTLPEAVQVLLRSDAAAAAAVLPLAPRFVGWFAALAERLDREGAAGGLDADHENFFAALEAALRLDEREAVCRLVRALSRHWVRSGAWERADAWVERAAGFAAALPPEPQVATLLAAGAYWHECHRIDRALPLARQALHVAETAGLARLQARAVLLFSSAAYHLGQPDEAIAPLMRIGSLARSLGDASLQRVAMNNLGNCHLSAGDLARARRVWAECDAGFDDEPPKERVATTFNLSLAAHYAGRHDEAMRLSEAAEAMERSGTPRAGRLLLILVRRGWMWCCRGEAAPAQAALRAARLVAVEAKLPVWERLCVAHEGKLALVAGRPERAAALLARGLHACAAGADPWDVLDLRLWLVHARLAWDREGGSAREALAELLAMPLPAWRHEQARILELAAASLLAGGRVAPAARAMAQAEALRRQQGIRRFPFEEGLARRTRAALRAQRHGGVLPPSDTVGESEDALAWLASAWD